MKSGSCSDAILELAYCAIESFSLFMLSLLTGKIHR